jgi:hypothetical protein
MPEETRYKPKILIKQSTDLGFKESSEREKKGMDPNKLKKIGQPV